MKHRCFLLILFLFFCGGCRNTPPGEPLPVREIPLAGEATRARAEISGLAWHGDDLIILPQYPGRFGDNIFTLPRTKIIAFLDGKRNISLAPRPLPFDDDGLSRRIPGFEGFEAIVCADSRVYVTVEASHHRTMTGYVAAGHIDASGIRLDAGTLRAVPSASGRSNMTEEALVLHEGLLYSMHELNGADVNPAPAAHVFSAGLAPRETVPFPVLDWRVTDATAADDEGIFWVCNTLYPLDAPRFGAGRWKVEQLVALKVTPEGIVRLSRPALKLQPDFRSRNWEGLVRLEDRGFLLVTDRVPRTILAFVPFL